MTLPEQSASIWGQAFEIAVKRGTLSLLLHEGLLHSDHPCLEPWLKSSLPKLKERVISELEIFDENYIEQVKQALSHMLIQGYGLGWTSLRQWLYGLGVKRDTLSVVAVWAPLSMPQNRRNKSEEIAEAEPAFKNTFSLPESLPSNKLTKIGQPAWSDFTLWLKTERKPCNYIIVQEFSYNFPGSLPDFKNTKGHLEELTSFAHKIDRRGVFSQISAEVKQDGFNLSPAMSSHLSAFVTKDKPFYKLCQGASYLDNTINLLKEHNLISSPIIGRVMAITSTGIEALAADFSANKKDTRTELVSNMGKAYREKVSPNRDPSLQLKEHLMDEMRMVSNKLLLSLPGNLRKQIKNIETQVVPGHEISCDINEEIIDFYRPTDTFDAEQANTLIGNNSEVDNYFKNHNLGNARKSILHEFLPLKAENKNTLRGLHASAVIAGFKAAKPGQLNVMALEGNPGIGKTTAVRTHLTASASEGFLFIYLSPRVVINRDVTKDFASSGQEILTLTTNASLIKNAQAAYFDQSSKNDLPKANIDSALVVEGLSKAIIPTKSNIWFIPSEDEDILEQSQGAYRFVKYNIDERTDQIKERSVPGVLRTLASGARQILEINPDVNSLTLTAALQSYKEVGNRTTVDSLSNIFKNKKADSAAGKAERLAFAKRFPRIVVMLDEVGGDGAGALFVHEIAKWLDRNFLELFEDDPQPAPSTISLVIADASLGNEAIMENYLSNARSSPGKVLISSSKGASPFQLAVSQFKVGQIKPNVLHIMTNSYPASRLWIRYVWNLHQLESQENIDGSPMAVRQLIKKQAGQILLNSARKKILNFVRAGTEQTIFFAQDKDFLSNLKASLCQRDKNQDYDHDLILDREQVAIIDSSVPAKERESLISEPVRDTKKVFLMTSSGARGISFPMATKIIAAIPRFNIESGLMEVAQLIYRGRGGRIDQNTNERVNCDDLPRELVLLIDDFMLEDDQVDDPRLWLHRTSDLLTLVMMLRATILTRITGDSGLRSKKLALVPVGNIGASELLTTMSQTIQEFLRESKTFAIRHKENKENANKVYAAHNNAATLFKRHCLKAQTPKTSQMTFTNLKELRSFNKSIGFSSGKLISSDNTNIPVVPDNIYCVGPFWLEDWSSLSKNIQESQSYDTFSSDFKDLERNFLGQLRGILEIKGLPSNLRNASRDILRMFIREQEDVRLTYTSIKELNTRNLWLAMPLDYPSFCRIFEEGTERKKELEFSEEWHSFLSKTLPNADHVAPIIPEYDDYPFVESIGASDPARMEMTFDDRYFLTSSEFNLLNSLLVDGA